MTIIKITKVINSGKSKVAVFTVEHQQPLTPLQEAAPELLEALEYLWGEYQAASGGCYIRKKDLEAAQARISPAINKAKGGN